MSTSTSNLPAIILAVVIVALLVVFYIADRGSSSDISNVSHSANTDKMIASKQKYEAHKSAFDHSGYSGSLKGYLKHAEGAPAKVAKTVQEHSGYSGSGEEYVQKHSSEETAALQANASDHSGFSGSLKQYLGGNYEHRQASKEKHHASSSEKESSSASKKHAAPSKGYSGSVDKYLKKYGN